MKASRRAIVVLVAVFAVACSSTQDRAAPSPPVDVVAEPQQVQVTPDRPDAPNIVVFMTDDQTLEQMAALSRTQERIFEAGATFTQSFVNLPSCCPSRATFLTGQHAVNHGVLANSGVSGGFANFEDQDATLATSLQAAGYQTIFVGKYLNGFGLTGDTRSTPPGWSDFRGLITPTEVLYHSPSLWVNDILLTFGESDYVTDVLTRQVTDALTSAARANAPVFAWISYPAPHAQAGAPLLDPDFGSTEELLADATGQYLTPPVPAARHLGELAGEPLPITATTNEAYLADKPEFLQRPIRSDQEMEEVRLFNQRGLESLLAVDESIEMVMDQIEADAGDRDTWFFFTSDNGLLLGAHRQFGAKYYAYDESARVPLGIVGPGVPASMRIAMPVSNIDLAPTIIDIAGAEPPRPADGISLLPYLAERVEPHGRAILIQGFDFRPSSPPYQAVHTGDSLLVEWATGDAELYDHAIDPYQGTNIVKGFLCCDLLDRNRALLAELRNCAGTGCHEIGFELDPPPPSPGLDQ